MSHTPDRPPAPAPSTPRNVHERIARCRALRRQRLRPTPIFPGASGAAEDKRRDRIRFNIRVARAVALISESRCTTRHACRRVGLKVGTKSETTVQRRCDQLGIPRWRASEKSRRVLQISVPRDRTTCDLPARPDGRMMRNAKAPCSDHSATGPNLYHRSGSTPPAHHKPGNNTTLCKR
jgi:hypothetical protein